MKVKDVICAALNILGRSELAKALTEGAALDEEGAETVNVLLYCFNAVEDEVARRYVPLVASENMISPDGDYYFRGFDHTPVKINRVVSDGKEIKFEVFALFLRAGVKRATVEYEYSPSKKTIDGDSDFGGEVGERLLALGVASEYCLINGEVEASGLWEKKYRKEIDGVQNKLPVCGNIPPRRWV